MKAVAQLKELPTSPVLEQQMLSCLVQWPDLIRELPIYMDHFTHDRYRKIFSVLSDLTEDNIPCDIPLAWKEIERRKWEGLCGPFGEFCDEMMVSVSGSNAKYYLSELEKIRHSRKALIEIWRAHKRIMDGDDPDQVLDSIEKENPASISTEIIQPQGLISALTTLYIEDLPTGVKTGWASLDPHFRPRSGELTLVTGIPGHGKTSWMDALLINLSRIHGWKTMMFSAENLPFENHLAALLEIKTGKPFRQGFHERMSESEMMEGMEFMNRHFTFLNPEVPSVESILTLAERCLLESSFQVLVIDPWNELEHRWGANQTETDYIREMLTRIRRFGKKHKIHIFLVAHPMKPKKDSDGSYPPPTPYDIAGGAHWRNRSDNCITVYRHISKDGEEDPDTEIHITKVKFREVGKIGVVKLRFDRITGRYCSI